MAMESYVAKRLEVIERELADLRRLIQGEKAQRGKRKGTLRGIWQGVEFTDEEIEGTKRALFKEMNEQEP